MHSIILDHERSYWISLPDSYHDTNASHKKYPVLVLLDGNVHFKSISGMVNYMSSDQYRSYKIPEMIVVGIVNVDRRRDYTPDKIITTRNNNSGGGEQFLKFLESELLPQIDRKYRTAPYRILYGHSLGGLLTIHAYMKEASSFNSFIAVDPSFGTWDSETMDRKLDSLTPNSFNRYLYIATANWGKRNFRNRDRHIRLFEGLHSKSKGDFPATLEYFEDENHSSVPVIAFLNGISTIYKGYGISYRDITSKEHLVNHYNTISDRLSWKISPPESLVNQLGYSVLRNDKTKALEYFILNTQNNPNSYNAFDSLGEAYEAQGNTKKAVESYKVSLKLNPNNTNAQNRIKQLNSN
jgi:predicted alpha/beta superfamily hydrolase